MKLHYHPLSSFCWKALIGLYELAVPFEPHLVDLSAADDRAALAKLWPMTKFPVLQDGDRAIPESSVVLEYVDREHRLIPADPARALECRLRDRIYDAYVHVQMQKIVGDHLRPADARDPFGVAHARAQLELAYSIVDDHARTGPWSLGDDFTLADCSAFPALYYANRVAPLARWTHAASYLARLTARPSIARVLREAQPYMDMFPA